MLTSCFVTGFGTSELKCVGSDISTNKITKQAVIRDMSGIFLLKCLVTFCWGSFLGDNSSNRPQIKLIKDTDENSSKNGFESMDLFKLRHGDSYKQSSNPGSCSIMVEFWLPWVHRA